MERRGPDIKHEIGTQSWLRVVMVTTPAKLNCATRQHMPSALLAFNTEVEGASLHSALLMRVPTNTDIFEDPVINAKKS